MTAMNARRGTPYPGLLLLALLVPGGLLGQSFPEGSGRPGDPTPTVVAVRVQRAPTIDGVLDEPFWDSIPPVTGFLQREPVDGARATERTEVRVAFGERALYFGFRLHDSEPGRIRRSILQREGRIDQDDRVIIALDTYHDGRNAYIFELNPFGTQGDAQITDERMTLADWNWEGVYESQARITEDGWELEVAIPFTTIRFSDAATPTMGVAFYRSIRRKNEEVTWPHIGQEWRSGISQVSRYATLTGLRDLPETRHLEVKPYAIAGAQRVEGGEGTDELTDAGLDVKYSITPGMTLDLTLNTDFAQVEADNVQINLTRFPLFFPEKREFFLERAGLFAFGDSRETEVFFSRRIGIPNDILGGGRLTGQAGPLSIGVLSLQTGDAVVGADEEEVRVPGANNSVVRLRADVLPRTTVGGIFTNRQSSDTYNRVAGLDAAVRFWGSSGFQAWAARSWDAEDAPGRTSAGTASLEIRPTRSWSASLGYTNVGAAFAPALGFVRRPDMVRYQATAALTPRFESSAWARSLVSALQGTYVEGQDHEKQSAQWLLHNMFVFQSGDLSTLNLIRRFERLEAPFPIRPGVEIPVGDYTFDQVSASVRTNESRTLSGRLQAAVGDFFHGTRTDVGGALVWKTGPHLTLSASASRNRVSLPVEGGDFSTTILGLDVGAAVSRDLFAAALIQYDDVSETLQANVRVDWIHTPGSDLFVVLDTGYFLGNALTPGADPWVRRTGVVKLTWLKAF